MFRVTQFSDLHFSTEPEGEARNTDNTWGVVFADAFETGKPLPDVVVLTGDIANNGTEAEYAKVADKMARLPVPAIVCIGNHDKQLPFDAVLPRPGLSNSRALRGGNWLFLFADSNLAGRDQRPDGSLVDCAGRPIHQCPSLSVNIDFENFTTLPPGYRTYEFCDDGSINTEAHLVGEDRWPSSQLPEIACRLLRGEISYWEMQEEWHGVHAH